MKTPEQVIAETHRHRQWYIETVDDALVAFQDLPASVQQYAEFVTTEIRLDVPWILVQSEVGLLLEKAGWEKQGYTNGVISHWKKDGLHLSIKEIGTDGIL